MAEFKTYTEMTSLRDLTYFSINLTYLSIRLFEMGFLSDAQGFELLSGKSRIVCGKS